MNAGDNRDSDESLDSGKAVLVLVAHLLRVLQVLLFALPSLLQQGEGHRSGVTNYAGQLASLLGQI